MKLEKLLFTLFIVATASVAQAATIDYVLEVDSDGPGTFKLLASTGNDSAGISGYGVDLEGDITSLMHTTPTSATANTNGTDFGPSGFTLARSPNGGNFVLASQDVNAAGVHPLYGVGQTPGSYADQGIIPINPSFGDWGAPIILAMGTYNGSIGFNENGPNVGGNVFVNNQGVDVERTDVTFTVIPEPTSLALFGLSTVGLLAIRRKK